MEATLDDIPAIMELWEDFMKEHDKIVLDTNPEFKTYCEMKEDAFSVTKNYFEKCVDSDAAIVNVAVEDEQVIGFCSGMIRPNIAVFCLDKLGYFGDLYIKPEYRGKHLSTDLRDKTIEWFKSKGITHVSLDVSPENSAMNIYKNWGFKEYRVQMRKEI